MSNLENPSNYFMPYSIVFQDMNVPGYERVMEVICEEVQLHAVISLHQTKMGPALGGVRAFAYPSLEKAVYDVLRLSRGMTYKATLSETGTGGGKSVILLPPGMQAPTEGMLRAFGQAVDSLQGKYIAAEDVGVSVQAIDIMREETPYVCGVESISGDPSVYTAHGVFLCIQETARTLWGTDSLRGKRIAIQGLGSVGKKLAHALFFAGAQLFVCENREHVLQEVVRAYSAQAITPEEFLTMECDFLTPCALGGVITKACIQDLKCKAIVGAANNQLEEQALGAELQARGILYAPDYLANAGGLLNVVGEIHQPYSSKEVLNKVEKLPEILRDIYQKSAETGKDTVALSDGIVEERLAQHG